ncbi:helix-turn-helix domain-containing protein [Clostridium sp.]|uniref:helix-turn-helix domain-containing protein n=1 Tax=Clostridium sp. TaxID=1506 RepID=UPI00284370A9|nr:helix-turn-helix domain-containing protein [Clostridium sp.]MDR3595118.1 helix-turn-helix domain-containing protein [Clostridium sp.]
MLDERQIEVARLIAQGMIISDIVKEVKVARSTIYEWKKLEEFNAEVNRFGQEFIYAAQGKLKCAAKNAADEMIKLLTNGKYEKTRLAAAQDILDRNLGRATTRVELDDSRDDKDNITTDILDQELNEFENE